MLDYYFPSLVLLAFALIVWGHVQGPVVDVVDQDQLLQFAAESAHVLYQQTSVTDIVMFKENTWAQFKHLLVRLFISMAHFPKFLADGRGNGQILWQKWSHDDKLCLFVQLLDQLHSIRP